MRIEIWSDEEDLNLDGLTVEVSDVETLDLNCYTDRAMLLCEIVKRIKHMVVQEAMEKAIQRGEEGDLK